MPTEYSIRRNELEPTCHHHQIERDGTALSYADVLELWQGNEAFLACFLGSLVHSPFQTYRWETPPISLANCDRRFEYVLLDSPFLNQRIDRHSFAEHFSRDSTGNGVVSTENLGGDALLVIPTPGDPGSDYSYLASFSRSASPAQQRALWRTVGLKAQERLAHTPMWISTAGGDVSWLHVRLDSRPKYYGYTPYKIG